MKVTTSYTGEDFKKIWRQWKLKIQAKMWQEATQEK
jgi:hypothetical protein